MTTARPLAFALAVLLLATTGVTGVGAQGGSQSFSGSVNLGMTAQLSGNLAAYGQAGVRGAQMALDDLNAAGGVLGKEIKLVSLDDAGNPSNAATNTRTLILNHRAVAIIGTNSSAAAAAQAAVIQQHRIPIFFWASNDISLTTTKFTKYSFQVVPNTYMEPRAVAQYLAGRPYKRYATVALDYNFGHSWVENFLAALKAQGGSPEVTSQQWYKAGTTDFTGIITAVLASKPDMVIFTSGASDVVTFTKQAVGLGVFERTAAAIGVTSVSELTALGNTLPANVVIWTRAPFFAIDTPGVKEFAQRYRGKHGEWPADLGVLAYVAVQSWATGARKAGAFDGDKISSALPGATVQSIVGSFQLRACDHQGLLPEYVGTTSNSVNPTYGLRTLDKLLIAKPDAIIESCAEAQAAQPK